MKIFIYTLLIIRWSVLLGIAPHRYQAKVLHYP